MFHIIETLAVLFDKLVMFHQGNLRPEEALQSLTIYEGNFGRLKDEREKCARAKEALELTDTGLLSGSEERVQVIPANICIKSKITNQIISNSKYLTNANLK